MNIRKLIEYTLNGKYESVWFTSSVNQVHVEIGLLCVCALHYFSNLSIPFPHSSRRVFNFFFENDSK